MVIGLKHGKVISDGTKYGSNTETTYCLVSELARKFETIHGSIYCRDLIGHDLSNDEKRAEVVKQGLFKSVCGKCILDAVCLLEETL